MKSLPVDAHVSNFQETLRQNNVVLLRAPTGTGKTVRVPQWCREVMPKDKKVWVLEPRRLATKAAAQGIAALNEIGMPQDVGFLTRFEKKINPQTPMAVATYGILLRRLLDDPLLEDIGVLILDEFHERSREMDLLLVHLRELLEIRNDLKLVIMSATIDVKPLEDYLPGAFVFDIEVENHPIEVFHHKPKETKTSAQAIQEGLAKLVSMPNDDGGDILAFVESRVDTEKVQTHFQKQSAFQNWEILICHGGVSSKDQDRLFAPSPRRRLIITTNVAESSVSIPGVTAVIENGYHRVPVFDAKAQLETLQTRRITRFNLVQRTGRAGRFGPGRALRLFSKAEELSFKPMPTPQLMSQDTVWAVLWLTLVVSPRLDEINFLDAPDWSVLKDAQTTLCIMGALDQNFKATAYGVELCLVPLAPRHGHLALSMAKAGFPHEGALAAALLESPTERFSGRPDDQSDFWGAISLARENVRKKQNLNSALQQTFRQLVQMLKPKSPQTPPAQSWDQELHHTLLTAYADRLCRNLQPDGQKASLRGQADVFRHPSQNPISTEYFLALQCHKSIRGGREKIWVGCAHGVTAQEINASLAANIPWAEETGYDPREDRIVTTRTRRLGHLILSEKKSFPRHDSKSAALLAQEALNRFDHLFYPNDEFKQLAGRLHLTKKLSDLLDQSIASEEHIKRLLPSVFLELKKLEQMKTFDWADFLLRQMSWEEQQELNHVCPASFDTPAKTKIKIDYRHIPQVSHQPILAVRIQEMFGCTENPTIGRGKQPLLIHLLGPNLRPVQTTQDLNSFWKNTYAEVRKELRRRYPKHAWPENPLEATPVRGGVKRRRP